MKIFNQKLLLILLCLSPIFCGRNHVYNYQQVNQVKENLKKHFQEGKGQCLTGTLYNQVRKDNDSIKSYIASVCSLKQHEKADDYISYNFGTYTKNLGAGSFGVVDMYTATNGTKFAIKKPKSFKYNLLFEELNASACIRELIGGKCDIDRNFAVIKQCVKHDSPTVNLVMRYYPMTLEDKINAEYKKPYDIRTTDEKIKVLNDMKVMAEQLNLMHSNELAHRDLKPENVMVDDDGRPIMVDFGMTTPNLLSGKTVAGSPLYMDYMIIRGNPTPKYSDLYAMALIFYEMVYGVGATTKMEEMCMNGGYMERFSKPYSPNWKQLNIPVEFSWLRSFALPSNRPDCAGMINKLDKMIAELEAEKSKKQEVLPTINPLGLHKQNTQTNISYDRPQLIPPKNDNLEVVGQKMYIPMQDNNRGITYNRPIITHVETTETPNIDDIIRKYQVNKVVTQQTPITRPQKRIFDANPAYVDQMRPNNPQNLILNRVVHNVKPNYVNYKYVGPKYNVGGYVTNKMYI